jgi:hypothetical protein
VDRHQQLTKTLRRLAPILAEVCATAQAQSARLAGTEWADACIYRTSLLNRLVGTARWGIATEEMLNRDARVAECGLHCNTTYEQQNQGRFYWTLADLGVVFTIRREAHKKPEEVGTLQMQIEGVLESSAKSFPAGALVAYLSVPPSGGMPTIDISRNGTLLETITLQHLLDEGPPEADITNLGRGPREPDGRPPRRVRSTRKPEKDEEGGAGEDG